MQMHNFPSLYMGLGFRGCACSMCICSLHCYMFYTWMWMCLCIIYMYMYHACVIRCKFHFCATVLLGRRLWGLPWLAGDCANRASRGVKRRVEEVMEDLYPRTMRELHALCDAKQVCYLSPESFFLYVREYNFAFEFT